jgi:hypothetical protein
MSENTNNENTEAVKPEEVIEVPAVEETKDEVVEAPVVEAPKPVEVKPAANAITVPEPKEENKPGLGFVGNGVMGSTTVPKAVKKQAPAKSEVKEDTVALHSTKNVSWQGVGKVVRGFNIVSKSAAEQWLTRDHIRVVTPQELAGEFGK